jgi:hypothetical protein
MYFIVKPLFDQAALTSLVPLAILVLRGNVYPVLLAIPPGSVRSHAVPALCRIFYFPFSFSVFTRGSHGHAI